MTFIDTVYVPSQTQEGTLTIAMDGELPVLTEDPEVILANSSTISAVTVQGELPQNTFFGVPARDRTNVLITNIDQSKAAKANIIQKIALDAAGTVRDTPGLEEYTQNVDMNTFVTGGPSSG